MDSERHEADEAREDFPGLDTPPPRPLITPSAALVVAVLALAFAIAWTFFALLFVGSSEKSPCVGDVGLGVQLVLALAGTFAAAGAVGSALNASRARPGAIQSFAIRLGVAGTAFVAWAFFLGVACG